jgi:hypothetical protein
LALGETELFERVGEPLAQVRISLEQFDTNANTSAVRACGLRNRREELVSSLRGLGRTETLDFVDAMTGQRTTSPNRDRYCGMGGLLSVRGDEKGGIGVSEHPQPLGALREWKYDTLFL